MGCNFQTFSLFGYWLRFLCSIWFYFDIYLSKNYRKLKFSVHFSNYTSLKLQGTFQLLLNRRNTQPIKIKNKKNKNRPNMIEETWSRYLTWMTNVSFMELQFVDRLTKCREQEKTNGRKKWRKKKYVCPTSCMVLSVLKRPFSVQFTHTHNIIFVEVFFFLLYLKKSK